MEAQTKPPLLPLLPLPAPSMADRHHHNHHHHHHHHISAVVELTELPPPKFDVDETDYSTSFADSTTSSNQNNSASAAATLTDTEVDSQFYSDDVNGFSSPFDDFGTVLRVRKKRLTSHWRSFIRPLMWRCKWAELKIKQFESQALRYAKKIASRDLTKHLAANQPIPEGFTSRSMPYTCQRRRRKLMKRRKRVRVEETIDADTYMSQHVLFSYNESKKSDPDGVSITDDFDEPEQNTSSQEVLGLGMHNNGSFLDEKDNDMEHIFRKIDMAHSRVHKLKAQLALVISEHARMFPVSENSNHLGPSEAQTSSVRSPTFSTCNGDAVSVGGLYAMNQHTSEFDMGGLGMSEHAISNYGESFHIPDIIESTVGTLSSIDVTQNQSQIGDSCENILDNILVHDETTEAERHTIRNCQHQVIVKQEQVKSEEEESAHLGPALETDTATKDAAAPQDQSTLKSCLVSEFQIPKNKRKRGERKAGSGNWSRQLPGEPDSQ
ncbi:hypothetical protein OSB04_013334 [Centaurea solstitialis]|uniref:Uncharacterized protein n=1 Tax=Centaurea solstitialis TaxID=347529 RepID=A0AA38TD20_9ASTR|nr:hypothetical protein OSB04_013334 [Centaurea solstitialis]